MFEVGTEVYLFRQSLADGSETRHRVAKIHKTGRFVLEGVHGQWTPGTAGQAYKAGAGHGGAHLRIATDEVVGIIAVAKGSAARRSKCFALVQRFEKAMIGGKWKRHAENTAFVKHLEAALATLEGPPA